MKTSSWLRRLRDRLQAPGTRRRFRRPAGRPALEVLEDRTVPSSIQGTVFHDFNGNSAFDAGEAAVGAGWTVYVDTNKNGALDAGEINTLTDAAGQYNLLQPDGAYSIRVVPQAPFQDDRLPLGTLVRDFASIENGLDYGSNNYSGLAWVNGSLYVTFNHQHGVADNVMYQADPLTGAALGPAVPIPGDVGEITFDGTDFWGADWVNNYLIRFNFAGQELQRLSFAGMNTNSVEWDGATLRVLDLWAGRIYQIDPSGTGTVLGSITTPPENCGGLAFDGTNLWVNGRDTDHVYALDPTTGAVQRSFLHQGDWGYGLALRGPNLWVSDNGASRVFQYDLGFEGGRSVTVAGADVTGVHLPVFQLGSISGRVFNDNNQNGLQDANDIGLAGWRVYIEGNANGQYDPWETSVVTDALGNYTLSDLRPGPYTVALDVAGQRLTRWSVYAPAGGTYSIALNSGDVISGKDFANFLDRSAPQPNEWGDFSGGRLNLYTGLVWVDAAEGTGSWYTFSGAVNYAAASTLNGYDDWRMVTKDEAQAAAIEQEIRNAAFLGMSGYGHTWTSTTAAGNKAWVVDLLSPIGNAWTSLKSSALGLAMVRDSATVVDDGDASYTDTGWKKASGGYAGDNRQQAAGNGSKTATWTFTGLEAGATYKVDVTWKVVSGAATNAPFTVLDGTTVVGTRSLNQTVAPNDFIVGAFSWEGLGTYTISGNTLSVKLSNLANGTVLADAVRIFKVLPSYAPATPLLAASVPSGAATTQMIASADVQPVLAEALRRWQMAGADTASLGPIDLRIGDLDGATLGMAADHTIWLDANAAGWGWFVDKTPWSDSEFATPGNQGEQKHMDLLSVLMHEMGHVLGLEHSSATGDVMNATLNPGIRLLPTASDLLGSTLAGAPSTKSNDAGKGPSGLRTGDGHSDTFDVSPR